mgnify:CR=1 FL=1
MIVNTDVIIVGGGAAGFFTAINLVENNVVAFELSHNDGLEDQHLPLKDNGWYWEYIFDDRFLNVYKILEFRNQTIKNVKKSVNLFNSMRNSSEF